MPELPEVEIVKQSLIKKVRGHKINEVRVFNKNLRFKLQNGFEKFMKNQKILNISRKSKYIIFHFQKKKFCLMHLGMSGTLHVINKKKKLFTNLSFYHSKSLPKKHNHIEFYISNFKLVYNDPRRFGFFRLIKSKKELRNYFKPYEPEALDKGFNINYLNQKLKNKTKNIKNLLIDQYFVSGIGNIYASEILHYSKINPNKKALKIKFKEMKNIVKFTNFVLKKAIKKGGSSIRNFKNLKGTDGNFQKEFKVYNREKQKCLREKCNGVIKKVIIGNRSTFYCNICQK